MEQRKFTVTPETGAFIHSLDALEQAKNVFYDALATQYGDESGEKLFMATTPEWDAITAKISEYLTISIVGNLGPHHTLHDDINI